MMLISRPYCRSKPRSAATQIGVTRGLTAAWEIFTASGVASAGGWLAPLATAVGALLLAAAGAGAAAPAGGPPAAGRQATSRSPTIRVASAGVDIVDPLNRMPPGGRAGPLRRRTTRRRGC